MPVRLQGAAFSGGTLHQQSPNDPEVAGVPDVTLAYVHKDKQRPYQVRCRFLLTATERMVSTEGVEHTPCTVRWGNRGSALSCFLISREAWLGEDFVLLTHRPGLNAS